MIAQPPSRAAWRTALRLFMAMAVLVARLLLPASPAQASPLDDVPICHAGEAGGLPGQPGDAPSHQHDCLACSVCHMASHIAVPASAPVFNRAPAGARPHPALPPDATGPPTLVQRATPATGPPVLSI